MTELFLSMVNRSISASWLVLTVLFLRLMLHKAPKWVHVLLWGLVAIRLVCPFTLESTWSLMPNNQTILASMMTHVNPTIQMGIPSSNNAIDSIASQSFTPQVGASSNPLQILISILAILWITGIVLLLFYTVISYRRLKRRVGTAVLVRNNIFQSEHVSSPFVLGMIKPRIYLPFAMDVHALDSVIAHEQAHIHRKDHWWKPLGFVILTVYWFNPLLWIAYVLLCRDIELACDEKVIRKMGAAQRAAYSQTLLSCTTHHKTISVCPLAFGEVGVKERVKHVLSYKKPSFWVIVVAVLAAIITAVCLLTNPKESRHTIEIVVPAGSQEPVVYSEIEISPLKAQIKVSCGDNLSGTAVSLKPVDVQQERAYDESSYLTPGITAELSSEKGGWFRIGVAVQNPTGTDQTVSVQVEPVKVRTPVPQTDSLESYRTDYVGNAPKVVAIAQRLPYPEGYAYKSISLQTDREPYGLTILLTHNGGGQQPNFQPCAEKAFDLIGNLGVISFLNEQEDGLKQELAVYHCDAFKENTVEKKPAD